MLMRPPVCAAALVCLIPLAAGATDAPLWPVTDAMPAGVKVSPADGRVNVLFGTSVGIAGDVAAIGASLDSNGNNASQGAIFVYERSGSAWPQKTRLVANEGAANDNLGAYTEVYGDQIFGGAPNFKPVAANPATGAIFVFSRSGGVWSETQVLTPTPQAQNNFGLRFAVDGNTLMVNGWNATFQNIVYVFTRQGASWVQSSILQPAEGGSFGSHITLSGNVAVIGASNATNASNVATGAAYVFTRNAGVWSQTARLLAGDGASGDNFGFSVSASGDDVAVGALGDDVGSFSDQGSAHVFHRNGSVYSEGPVLYAPDGAGGDGFGKDLRLCGNHLYVGASKHSEGGNSQEGVVYRWDKVGTTWTYVDKFTLPTPGRSNAYFGDHLGVSGNDLVVGAPFADQAYVYTAVCNGDAVYRSGFE